MTSYRAQLLLAATAVFVLCQSAEARHRHCGHAANCGGGCDYSPCVNYQPYMPTTQTVQRTVMVPKMFTETGNAEVTEWRSEQRVRNYTVQRRVPVTRTQQYEYLVSVPKTQTKTVQYTVARPVTKTVEQQYTEIVPYTETRTGTRQVCRMVSEKRTRTVCVDQGHWEEVTIPTRACGNCAPDCTSAAPLAPYMQAGVARSRHVVVGFRRRAGYSGDCGQACGPAPCDSAAPCAQAPTVTQRRWVPQIVTKQVQYTVMRPQYDTVSYEYPITLCRAEARTRSVQVCEMVPEERTRDVNYTTMVQERRTARREICTYRTVSEQRTSNYTVQVPYTVQKPINKQVCRMVPVTVTCEVRMNNFGRCEF